MAFIQTVLGRIDPADLGVTDIHEHLICRIPGADGPLDPDLILDNETLSGQELDLFRQSGGQAMVEFSTADYGRDLAGLARLSRSTGVHIIAVTGFHKAVYSRRFIEGQSLEGLVETVVRELTHGVDGFFPGAIKAGTSLNCITPTEEIALRVAARAHRATGAPIVTHTEAGTMALEQLAILRKEGVSPQAVILGHLDRKLEWEYIRTVARTGAYMAFDQISKEKYYPDRLRIEFLRRLEEEGYGHQILLGMDLGRKSYLTHYGGGPGFSYLLRRFVPWLHKEGFSEVTLRQWLVNNPARALQFRV